MELYEVRLTNTFEAENCEDAVRLMIDWVNMGYAEAWSYAVFTDTYPDGIYIDGEDLQ